MKKFFFYLSLIGLIIGLQSAVLYGQQKTASAKSAENMITVGPGKADVTGNDNRAIQNAIDKVALRGGGTVHVLPGEYIINDPVHLKSNIHLVGEGPEKTIFKHAPSVSSPLLKDADIGQKEATPKDVSLFKVGMGIAIRSNRYQNDMLTRPLTITKIEGGVLYFNDYVEWDFTADWDGPEKVVGGGVVTNIFPVVWGFGVNNVKVEGITVDSKVEDKPGWMNDAWTAGICMERCQNCNISNIKAINTRGDGVVLITCEHCTIEKSEGANNTHHGFHTGAHSPWSVIKNCVSHDNGSDGIYICWGVRYGEITDNTVYHNGFGLIRNGISIGHKDTDCLLARNHIYNNAKDGIRFRVKTEPNGPHRAKVIDNIIENNGVAGAKVRGAGIHICGMVHDVTIENNTIRDTRQGAERLQVNGIFIEKGVDRLKVLNNKITGHPEDAIVDNSKSPDNQLQIVAKN
jgi:hypothetical protein